MELTSFGRLCAALALASFVLAGTPQAAGKELTFATGSVTSDDYQLGAAWSNALIAGKSEFRIVPIESGTVRGLRNLALGKADLATIGAPHFQDAINRTGSYKEDPPEIVAKYKDLRVLFATDSGFAQYVTRSESPIRRFTDLKGKRVAIGRPGGNAGRVSQLLFEAHGIKPDDLKPQYLDYGPALDQLGNNQIDATLVWGGIPHAALDNASRGNRLRFVSPDEGSLEAFRRVVTNGQYYVYRTVSPERVKEAYGDRIVADGPVRFWTFPFMVMVHKDMPEATAHAITKALWDNIAEIRKASAALALLDAKSALEGISAEVHPGAQKYFKNAK